jgi:hypothetical protein
VKFYGWIVLLALPLGGCEFQTFKSSVAGSCAVFERPPYAVRGKTPYDQGVADNFVESGVAGCNWPRPAARPAELDAPAPARKVVTPANKRGVLKRIRDRVAHPFTAPVAPVAPFVPSPPLAAEPASIERPPKPRDPIDELLHPDDSIRKVH